MKDRKEKSEKCQILSKKEKIIKQEEGDENSNLNASTNDKLVNLHSPCKIRTIGMGVAVEAEETRSSFEEKVQQVNLHICKLYRSSSALCLQIGLQFMCAPWSYLCCLKCFIQCLVVV